MVAFRRATGADVADIRALVRAAYEKWIVVAGREPKPMGTDYDRAVRDNLVDLIYLDDLLAGLIVMVPSADHLLIDNVAVQPEFQRRGLGRLLLAHVEEVAAALGASRLRLFTNKLFDVNVKLYSRIGYRIDREETFKGGVVVHMSKEI